MKPIFIKKRFPFLKHGSLAFCLFFAVIFILFSFSIPLNEGFKDLVARYFDTQKIIASEKLYLHTDKSIYITTETIYFKGYLLDAVTHSTDLKTNFIYVELIDRQDSLLVRKKFRRDSLGHFVGDIEIPAIYQPGDYYIRAYTEWMRNFSSDFFFYKKLQIANAIVTDIKPKVDYITNDDGERIMKVGFFNDQEKPYVNEKLTYIITDNTGKKYRSKSDKTNTDGVVYIKLDERSLLQDDPRVDIILDDDKFNYKKSFYPQPKENDYAVTFFPEGGDMLSGVPQAVAFKAQNKKGFSQEITGAILNSNNDTIAHINTEHNGMGRFIMTAKENEKYRLETKATDGSIKSFDIPTAKSTGVALSVSCNNNKVLFKILAANNAPINDTMYLIAHTRAEIVCVEELIPGKSTGAIAEELFKDGITHFVLTNSNGVPISERVMLFYNAEEEPIWSIQTDKDKYTSRQKVEVTLDLKDNKGNDIDGDFSVSVTDGKSIPLDSISDNIISNILLSSDIKGEIENPTYYFSGNSSAIKYHRDLLMTTQGWSRFKIEQLSEIPKTELNFFKERGQFILGHMTNITDRRSKEGGTIIAAYWDNKDSLMKIAPPVKVNENGNFILENIDFIDTTRFMIQGRTKARYDGVTVHVDSVTQPNVDRKIYFRDNYNTLSNNYIEKFNENYINSGGMPVISLKEVYIYGNKMRDKAVTLFSDMYSAKEIRKDNVYSLYDMLIDIPYMKYMADKYIYKGSLVKGLLIEGIELAGGFLDTKNIDFSCIDAIEIIPDIDFAPTANKFSWKTKMSTRTDGPYIYIHLNKIGYKQWLKVSPGLILFRLLGYSEAKEFYNPVYDTPEKKNNTKTDIRTTIYWNNSLKRDKNGKIQFNFYTSDSPGNYDIIIEGLSKDNRPLYYKTLFN